MPVLKMTVPENAGTRICRYWKRPVLEINGTGKSRYWKMPVLENSGNEIAGTKKCRY